MSRVIEVSVDQEGRIVIPAAVSGPLGLTTGTTLVAEVMQDGDVCLTAQPESPMLVNKGGVLVIRARAERDLSNIVEEHREERIAELISRGGW
jgi:bifunctional DNA-binding transcriptional regulator/antitoxin component of YhaV-PrlF toxin-antitoxin module